MRKMGFKSIIVSPVIRPDQDYRRREIWHLKQEIKDIFKNYGSTSCLYLLRNSESSFYGYQDNFAIVDFGKGEGAGRALRAVENGEISINGLRTTAKPIEMTSCPINRLPDNCLLEIFENLSTYEQLKLSSVCKHWGQLSRCLWRVTKIDLRDRSLVHKNKKYIVNSGSHLREIYCYDDYGLKIIGDHCPNLEKIALEFRRYTTRRGLDRACIQYERQTLQTFANLTRLMLKIRTPQYTYFSFLQELPAAIVEMHLFNDIPEVDISSVPWESRNTELANRRDLRKKYGRKTLDFSRFPDLQALTLKGYYLDDDSLIGIEKLDNLICLRLDNSHLSQLCLDKLKSFGHLEELSLRRIPMEYEEMWLILVRNQALRYLALPTMKNSRFDEDIWSRALELPHLKTLCWTDIDHKIRETGASTTVEYIEHHNIYLSDRRTILLLENFPNLKSLKRTGMFFSSYFTSSVAFFFRDRVDKTPFRFYHDRMGRHPCDHNSQYFKHSDQMNDEDARIFRSNEWAGWYIDDSSPSSPRAVDEQPVESVKTSPTIVEELSDTCLNRIFDHLPLDDKLTAAEVSKRWRRLLGANRENWRTLDVRGLSRHERRERCMVQCGKYLEDIYSYKSCGFSGIRNHCPNVKSLALDFGVKRCRCRPSTPKERYSLHSLRPIVLGLKHLTRIMLRDASVFQSDMFTYLPESLEEIHVFNRSPMYSGELAEGQVDSNSVDLSRYSKLRALSLIEITEHHQETFRTVRVIGLENLGELTYLRISGVIIAEEVGNPLRNIERLEYLCMPLGMLSSDNFEALIENNRNLEYLDISDDFNGIPISRFLPVLSLQRLKVLRMVNMGEASPDDEVSDDLPAVLPEFESIHRLADLEVMDCGGFKGFPEDLLLQLIGTSRRLRMFSVDVSSANFAEEVLAIAESNLIARPRGQREVRAFVGLKGFKLCHNLNLHAEGVILSRVPSLKYLELVGRNHWRGWISRCSTGYVARLCDQLDTSLR